MGRFTWKIFMQADDNRGGIRLRAREAFLVMVWREQYGEIKFRNYFFEPLWNYFRGKAKFCLELPWRFWNFYVPFRWKSQTRHIFTPLKIPQNCVTLLLIYFDKLASWKWDLIRHNMLLTTTKLNFSPDNHKAFQKKPRHTFFAKDHRNL